MTTQVDFEFRDVQLSQRQVMENLTLYDTDVHVRSASSIFLESLLSGGLRFHSASAAAVSGKREQSQRAQWERQVWERWTREAMRSLWSNGICATIAVPHPEYDSEPRVLQLDKFAVHIREDMLGERSYRYFPSGGNAQMIGEQQLLQRRGAASGTHAQLRVDPIDGRVEVENVITIELDAPNADGSLRSKMMALYRDWNTEQEVMRFAKQAMAARATPVLVLQQAPPSQSSSLTTPYAEGTTNPLGYGDGTSASGTQGDYNDMSIMVQQPSTFADILNSKAWRDVNERMSAGSATSAASAAQNVVDRSGAAGAPRLQEYELHHNAVLTRHVLPEVPAELISLREERERRVFLLFHIPPGMVDDERKRVSSAGASSGLTAGSQSDDVFSRALQAARGNLEVWINALYGHFHYEHELAEFVAAQPQPQLQAEPRKRKRESDADQTKHEQRLARRAERAAAHDERELKRFQAQRTRVTVGSQPDQAVVDKLWTIGALSFSGLREFYSQSTGIDLSLFNTQPEVPLSVHPKELKPPPSVAGGKPKAKAKAKTKSSKPKSANK